MNISENFTMYEAVHSDTASRHNIDNRPDHAQLVNIVHSAMWMEKIRSLFNRPIAPSSWFRCLELNRRLGSNDSSDHIEGRAVDFVIRGMPNRDAFEIIKDSDIGYDTLILEFEHSKTGGWLHISFPKIGDNGVRKNLVATGTNGSVRYTHA